MYPNWTNQIKPFITKDKVISTLVLAFALLSGGIVSVYLGKELGWDLANYHYYNAYAFLHGRYKIDYWPISAFTQFFNPVIDLLPYFLINHFKPLWTEFCLGAIHGLNLWLSFLIACEFIKKKSIALFLAVTGLYAPSVISGLGSFQNDAFVSIFLLVFILFYLKSLRHYLLTGYIPYLSTSLAGFFVGVASGFKLTAMTFLVGGFISHILLPIKMTERVKLLLLWGFFALVGLSLIAGYWMWLLWSHHGNPFFPFMNGLFRSPDFAPISWHDLRLQPKSTWQALTYPFYFSTDTRYLFQYPNCDLRYAVIYVLFILTVLQWIIKKKTRPTPLLVFWFYSFTIATYIVWQINFSVSRYLITIEMLVPLIIYLLVTRLIISGFFSIITLTVIYSSLFYFMSPGPLVRFPWYEGTFFNVKLPKSVSTIPHATVFVAFSAFIHDEQPRPQTYLIPFFPKGWHFIGVPYFNTNYYSDPKTEQHIFARLLNNREPLFLLSAPDDMPNFFKGAKHLGLLPHGECEKIQSDRQKIFDSEVLLCPVIAQVQIQRTEKKT